MRLELQRVNSDYSGFLQLTELAHGTSDLALKAVELDMGAATWVDANMCAPLGAILYRVSRGLNAVRLTHLRAKVRDILAKNGFLSTYGEAKRPDRFGTTIEYMRFEPKDARYFAEYVESRLASKEIPKMSAALLKKFRESIFEIFSNAVIHSETNMGIFACGQFFPGQHRLDFSVADLGIGIQQNLMKKRGIVLSAEDAINWATEGKNTTKTGPIPGGLGLKLLREFISLNHGRMQIASDRGYWELTANGQERTDNFPYPFPGTVVNIEINTADTSAYRLTSEPPDDIF